MVKTEILLLQITNAIVTTMSSISGPNSIAIVNGEEYVEFDILPTDDADEFYKEYWIVGTDLYLYLNGHAQVCIYKDALEEFIDFVGYSEHKIDHDQLFERMKTVYGK